MDTLLRIQEDIYRKICKGSVNFKKSPKERVTESYIETRLESLDKQWSSFNNTHQKIICQVEKREFEESEYYLNDFYSLTEDSYMDYKTELKERLLRLKAKNENKGNDSESSNENDSINVKLPRIAIPIFSGSYSEWTTFRDLFLSLIHNNKSLQNVQKLHYLKCYLAGEAEQLLRHLPITNENYLICWELLEHRFNNKKFITNCILQRFFGQRNITNESSHTIKQLFDTTNECLNGLVNVGINIENWDIIVIYILALKLDNESRKQWEAKICSLTDELPTLKQFLQFLEHRFKALEFLSSKTVKTTHSHHVVTNTEREHLCAYCSDFSHKIGNCKRFFNEDLQTRRNFVQRSHLCFNCLGANHLVTSCRLPTRCRICKRKHHSLLHSHSLDVSTDSVEGGNQSSDSNTVVATTTTFQDEPETENITTCFSNIKGQVLLATALVKAETSLGSSLTLRALLDQGSQASFITESAVQLLGLKKIHNNSTISGVGSDDNSSLNSRYIVHVKLQSIQDPMFTIVVKAHVLSKLTSFLPEKKIVVGVWPNLSRMKLADPKFNIPNKIDMLLGAEVYCQIIDEGLIRGPLGSPIAQNTKLGWILSGNIVDERETGHVLSCHSAIITNTEVNNEDFNLKKFWQLESDISCFGKKQFTLEEQRCEDLFRETTTRDSSGRYVVKLPFRDDDPCCKYGNSREIATKRFLMLEKRLLKSVELKIQYSDVILEYLKLGHMEVIPPEEIDKVDAVYLPHHAVVRDDKTTKVRVVFDASCQDHNGASLNGDLMVGPTLQLELRHIVMRWRLHPICLVADIVKMYRQVKVADDAIDYQRLVWRTTPEENLQHLRLMRVTFGTASAPYLAVRSLQQVAHDEGKHFPLTSEKILQDFYMDDLLTGCQTVCEGKQIYKEANDLLSKGGFELQGWSSNNKELLDEIGRRKETVESHLELKEDDIIKILGLTWNRKTDNFEYSVKLPPINIPVTKRKVISDIARLFDPLGWMAPVIIKAKIFIQRLWLAGIGWDEELPRNLLNDWMSYRDELTELTKFRLPRWIGVKHNNISRELHGFSDASNEAYAAVVYIRVVDDTGVTHVQLITSKTKVAPIKQVSIPRLELCGAVLLARLLQEVSEVMNVPRENLRAWTDSMVVLAWLSSHPSRWKTFIANRVSEILNILDREKWSHVSSSDNPADLASRGSSPSKFSSIGLWKTGPKWLYDKTIVYDQINLRDTNLEEKGKKVYAIIEENQLDLWTRFSSLRKLVRVLAYCKRFIHKLNKSDTSNLPTWLTRGELEQALFICVKEFQRNHFSQEITDLKKGGIVNKKSKLTSLNPFLDDADVLRVGGRLERIILSNDKKHPMILPSKSHFTNLVIAEAHEKTLHGGPQIMVNFLRSKYWIINAKNLAKIFVRKCVICVRHAARLREQLMGQLPPARGTPIRPFYRSGVDYAGPIQIRTSKGRGYRAYKGYICLFVCMATRAIHLEAVSDLTSQGFMAAFKRFVSRRGHCADLFSDNATNFVGASRELQTLFAQEKSTLTSEIAASLADNGTTWHFIPPYAANFGGLWESGIKSTKHHLRRVIGTATLTFEEMTTLLSQIEACLNSRPLSQISTNPNDPMPLTPGHFLIGEPLILVPDTNYENSPISSLKRWQLIQKMLQTFWRKWSQEYLTQFLQRYKWAHKTQEPNIGDVVLVKEDDIPPARWLLGIVTEKHTGLDNITRVVSLKCKGGKIKRPVNKLCVLPVAE